MNAISLAADIAVKAGFSQAGVQRANRNRAASHHARYRVGRRSHPPLVTTPSPHDWQSLGPLTAHHIVMMT